MTPHFSFDEAVRTKTGLANTPSPRLAANIGVTAALYMEPIRRLLGAPVIVSSWYRSKEVNRRVGGSETSDHLDGVAVDWTCPTLSNYDAACKIRDSGLPFDQLILEYGWVHTGFGHRLRRECLTKRDANSPYLSGLVPR